MPLNIFELAHILKDEDPHYRVELTEAGADIETSYPLDDDKRAELTGYLLKVCPERAQKFSFFCAGTQKGERRLYAKAPARG